MATKEKTEWVVRNVFQGLSTKKDPSKTGAATCTSGQNVQFTDTDKISVRKLGYSTYPNTVTASTDTTKIESVRTFRRRDGENVLIRNQSTALEFFDETTIGWVVIESGFTAGIEFGYAEANINTDQTSFIYLGNGQEDYARWTGAKSHLTTAVATTDTQVIVGDATDFPPLNGTIVMAGVKNFYTSRTDTTFNISGTADVTHVVGSTVTAGLHNFSAAPKGNILLANDNRVFIAGQTAVLAAVHFSEYGDASNFVGASLVTDSTADSPGIFNLAEGGGPVVGMAFDENSTYIIKRNLIYKATLTDALYTITPLKSFDGKSQTTGGITPPFAGENGIFFVTPDKKIYHLTRLPQIDFPQIDPISDVIKPTVEALHFERARGIVFKDQAFIACSSTKGTENDRVLVYDIKNRIWHTLISGWNVTDWAIYKTTIGTETDDELFFASNNTKNVFQVTTTPVDGDFNVTAIAVMNQETFGSPAERKYLKNFFLEGYIEENTTLNISLLFDDSGFTQQLSGSIKGTETDFIFDTESLNMFGSNPFGLELFGGVSDGTGKRKFRLYLKNTLRTIPFYNVQLQLSSSGENQDWEVINYAWLTGIYEQPENRNLYKKFT